MTPNDIGVTRDRGWESAVDPARIASGERLPSLHSSQFAPVPEPTLRGGIKAMTVSVLELLR